ncbi:murein biosynthesis integral membrane protein MurJ [Salinarimonas ramus]|uniref:Probable lipid II flippase MurJ n=1 Tax=Salinarimonas ramus TaxID=690164 RepID=A0A917Q6T8_9HYPH|nr:murein biosynthesis integral membrane protein MurJ [Salinarimonas ramus]GGK32329.1 putative lipid II flippase MurJ [Salinarimonas ramus]
MTRTESARAATLVVSLATLASRVLGFVRDVLVAATLGAGPVADAFLVAFRLPNLARRALAEGALTAGFAPLYGRVLERDGARAAARLGGEALSGLALLLALATALAMIGAGALVLAVAAGFADDAALVARTTELARLALPGIVGFGCAGLLAAMLAARERVAALALAPLATNLVLIASLLLLPRLTADPELLARPLAGSVALAGFVQLAIVAVAARRIGAVTLALPRLGPELRTALALVGPALVTVASVELVFLAATQAASFTPGLVARLYYAERLVQLPLGIVASVATTVLLPRLATRVRAGDSGGFAAAQNRALEATAILALPAATGLLVLAEPIVRVLFVRGAFGEADAMATAAILAGLALGLPLAAAAKILQQGAFARERARPGLVATMAAIAATLAACFLLTPALGPLGLGLGVAAGLLVQAGALAIVAMRVEGWRPDARLVARLGRAALASAIMAGALVLAASAGIDLGRPLPLALACIGGGALYALAAVALGAVTRADLAGGPRKSPPEAP